MAFKKTIRSFSGPHAFLSNMYPVELQWRGMSVGSVEHAYQASKCALMSEAARVASAISPVNAKAMARRAIMRKDWDSIKLVVMWDLLMQKFEKPEFSDMLVSTGKDVLIEGNTWGDVYWGICDGRGFNHLGQLLMVIREMRLAETEI